MSPERGGCILRKREGVLVVHGEPLPPPAHLEDSTGHRKAEDRAEPTHPSKFSSF